MFAINFYYTKSKTTHVWSLRIKKRTFTFRIDKIGRSWKSNFLTYKLEDLNILGLYYEVGFIKEQNHV